MLANEILSIFYNEIVKEAQTGRIDCFFMMNIAFNTTINNVQITNIESLEYEDVLIPTLKITNKEYFDALLVKYVLKAIEFYNESEFDFLNDIIYLEPNADIETLKTKYLIKYIICTLLANASTSDFDNPINFLQNRIDMIDNPILNTNEQIDLGYLESINARLHIIEEQSPIKAETPYRIRGYLEFDDGYKLTLPEIYAGNTKDKYMIYGVQNTSKTKEEDKTYIKQIRKGLNSRLYAVPEHYFLTYMLFLSLCHNKPIEIVPFLIERWNGKVISLHYKKNMSQEEKESYKEITQNNITNTFLRTFFRIEEVTTEYNIDALPYTIDDRLHITLGENFTSKAKAFEEINTLAKEKSIIKTLKK